MTFFDQFNLKIKTILALIEVSKQKKFIKSEKLLFRKQVAFRIHNFYGFKYI